jgi:hypothetical protein
VSDNKVSCLVVVNGYTEGKFDPKRSRFWQILAAKPHVGDVVVLEPGSTWGVIQCVVEHCKISEAGITLYTRLMTDADYAKLAEYGD